MVDGGADFVCKFDARDDSKLVIEFPGDGLDGAGVGIEMRRLAGDFEMSAAGEVAGNVVFAYDLFDKIN